MRLSLIRWVEIKNDNNSGLKNILPFKEFYTSSKMRLKKAKPIQKLPVFTQLWREKKSTSLISIMKRNTRPEISTFWKRFSLNNVSRKIKAITGNESSVYSSLTHNNIDNCNWYSFKNKTRKSYFVRSEIQTLATAYRFSMIFGVQGCHFKPWIAYGKTAREFVLLIF